MRLMHLQRGICAQAYVVHPKHMKMRGRNRHFIGLNLMMEMVKDEREMILMICTCFFSNNY